MGTRRDDRYRGGDYGGRGGGGGGGGGGGRDRGDRERGYSDYRRDRDRDPYSSRDFR